MYIFDCKPGAILFSVIPALGRLKQEFHKLKISLGYIVRIYLKNKQTG
jgi:hypothetical protein